MEFLKKLLDRTPTITMDEHVRIVVKKIAEARRPLVIQVENLEGASDHNYKCWNEALKELQIERDTVARLVRTKRAIIDDLATARAEAAANAADAEKREEKGKDDGATYVLSSLASTLHVDDWSIENGSEEWEGDVWATMFRVLVDAGVVEEDHHQVATFAEIAAIRAERDELLPDALKHRERLQRDREYHAARRLKPA